jgi:DNA polymerase III delta subunit
MIYFYYGEDDLSIRRQLDSIKSAFSEKHGSDNISQIDAEATPAEIILQQLVNISLLSTNRLIILRGAFANHTLREELPLILPRIDQLTELLIVEQKPDKRLRLYKTLLKDYQSKEFPLVRDKTEFVLREAERLAVKIDPSGVSQLIDYTAGDQWRIASELEKFNVIGQTVTKELVLRYVEPELSANAFDLLDNLLAGRTEQAAEQLDKLRLKEDANRFFALLASQVFALSAVVNARSNNPSEITKDIGVHPYVVQKLSTIAKKLSPSDVKRYCTILSETDQKLKAAKIDAWTLVKLAILQF